MTGKYVVDWGDESYPSIRHGTQDDPAQLAHDPVAVRQTLGACKTEIYGRAADEMSHWRAQVAKFRAMRASDIKDTTETEDT